MERQLSLVNEIIKLEQSLAVRRQELKAVAMRNEERQAGLQELRDLELILLVHSLRRRTPDNYRDMEEMHEDMSDRFDDIAAQSEMSGEAWESRCNGSERQPPKGSLVDRKGRHGLLR